MKTAPLFAAMLLLQACASAPVPPQPGLQPALAPLTGFIGSRHCTGSFLKSGKAISSVETIRSDLSGYWLTLRHDDDPPFTWHALELWGYDAKARRFIAHIYINSGSAREFDSPGWQGDSFTWTNVDIAAAQRDRFVFERQAGGYRFTYEVSADGSSWTGVDSLLCVSAPSSPGGA